MTRHVSFSRRLSRTGRSLVTRIGDWALVALPAAARWVHAHTRLDPDAPGAPAPPGPPSSSEPAPEEAPTPTTEPVTSSLPALAVPTEGPLSSRVETFLHVLRGATGAYAAFVADDQGLPLATTASTEEQVAVTAALDRALAPVRATLRGDPLGNVTLEIERDNVLQAIWFRGGGERYVLGLVLPQALGGDVVAAIRSQARRLFAPPSHDEEPAA